jgi:aldehyde:ferredoxin oxidoreductase
VSIIYPDSIELDSLFPKWYSRLRSVSCDVPITASRGLNMNGYAGSILQCNLSQLTTTKIPTSNYADAFLGGRGLASRLYWEQAAPEKEAFDPANPLIITTGPLAGFSGLAGSRWAICSKSPSVSPQTYNYSNFGGSWGAHLKFAGLDALVIKETADKPMYLFLHDGICEFKDALHLWGKGAARTREIIKEELGQDVRVLSTGPAGENMVSFAIILAEDDACGAAGFGAVMGSKKLKAIAVQGTKGPEPADPARLKTLATFLRKIKKKQPFQIPSLPPGAKVNKQVCFGCIAGCDRYSIKSADGRRGKYMCASGPFYEDFAGRYYGELNEVPFIANRMCDDYGLDTNVVSVILGWLSRCHQNGLLSDKQTGLPFAKLGSLEFINDLLRKITFREGFGSILAEGPIRAARNLGSSAEDLLGDHIARDGSDAFYLPRMYIANSLLFALEPRQPYSMTSEIGGTVLRWLGTKKPQIGSEDVTFIAEHFWGSRFAADFTTYRGKALAAKMVQDRLSVKDSAILCHFSWHPGDIELFRTEIISEILLAVTGLHYDKSRFSRLGERISNMQRAAIVRDRSCGRAGDVLPEFCFTAPVNDAFLNPDLLVPDSDRQPVTRKDSVLGREQFELMKDEYYLLRGWDVDSGLQKESTLCELGLEDVALELRKGNLVR